MGADFQFILTRIWNIFTSLGGEIFLGVLAVTLLGYLLWRH